LLPLDSRFHSSSHPHRTSTFQRIRRSNSGGWNILFACLLTFRCGSLLLPVRLWHARSV